MPSATGLIFPINQLLQTRVLRCIFNNYFLTNKLISIRSMCVRTYLNTVQSLFNLLSSNKMKESSKQKSPFYLKSNQPLLKILKPKITVFNDRIQIEHLQHKIASLNNLDTNPTLTEIPPTFREIRFDEPNIVFKLLQSEKKILLSKIGNFQKPFLELAIENNQERRILHSILRKKWCEAGFQDQYDKLEQIGKGAMAKVYLISRKSDGKKFAAKIISLKIQCEKTYDTFINQTQILRILKSPHIVALEGVYISQKKELIEVLEYLNGGTLFTELKQNLLRRQEDKVKAIRDITTGLEHLRQKRIVHRDLKLENIMIRILPTCEKQYVITDFGLSNWMGEKNILFQKCGTPGYLAPQILHQKKGVCLLTHSTDIFSLGILYHYIFMHTGIFNYEGCAKKLLEENKKAMFSLDNAVMSLNEREYILLFKTLDIDPEKRATSKELLEQYIPQLQSYIQKKNKQKQRQNKLIFTSTPQIQPLKLQQRVPSYRKKNISVTEMKTRAKTQVSQQKDPNSSRVIQSARNAIKKITTKIGLFGMDKKESFKPKDRLKGREEMKSFVYDH